MTVVFEPSDGFDKVNYFYRTLASKMLIGKEFGSLEEALKQTTNVRGKDVPLSRYFEFDKRGIAPGGFPLVVSKIGIVGISTDEDGTILHNTPGINVRILTARYSP